MSVLIYLIPVALALGAIGLAAFLWSLKSGQFDDLDGAAARILLDDESANDNRAIKDKTEAQETRAVSTQSRSDGTGHA